MSELVLSVSLLIVSLSFAGSVVVRQSSRTSV